MLLTSCSKRERNFGIFEVYNYEIELLAKEVIFTSSDALADANLGSHSKKSIRLCQCYCNESNPSQMILIVLMP